MEPIRVPRPSPTAFHKNRRISDLLLSQIKHFQHVAQKRSLKMDPEIARDMHTEGGAARYIATVTRALRKNAPSTPAKLVPVDRGSKTRPGKPGKVTRIAAAAKESKPGRSKKRATAQRATAKNAKRVQPAADTAASKKSSSRKPTARRAKLKAGSKVNAKSKPAKRKKS
jgi:hypothetical protein